MNQKTYDELRHDLDTKLIQGSTLHPALAQSFVAEAFTALHTAYQAKHISYEQYIKLINRLAAYKSGRYNDYLDMLTGAATMDMLDIVIDAGKQGIPGLTPEDTRNNRDRVTKLTGVEPVEPEQE